RFAKRGLEGQEGFLKCLKLTLYRPRDVLSLLNGAWQVTCAQGRDALIDTDIEATATRISRTRLQDLIKEYEQVLPGLSEFADAFKSRPASMTYSQAVGLLETVVEAPQVGPPARLFALLGTGAEAFNALYSVGFIGVQEPDGS